MAEPKWELDRKLNLRVLALISDLGEAANAGSKRYDRQSAAWKEKPSANDALVWLENVGHAMVALAEIALVVARPSEAPCPECGQTIGFTEGNPRRLLSHPKKDGSHCYGGGRPEHHFVQNDSGTWIAGK